MSLKHLFRKPSIVLLIPLFAVSPLIFGQGCQQSEEWDDAGPDSSYSDTAASDVLDTTTDPVIPPDSQLDGDGFPLHPQPVEEGLISRVDDSFWTNMDDLVFNVLQESEVQLYLAILDANFFNKREYRAWGMEILRNPESFFANAVIPMLQRYGGTGAIWAVDCLNEPEALVAGSNGNGDTWGLSWQEMQEYLRYCAQMVHMHSDLPVSAGSGWHDWANIKDGYYNGLDFDFLDYHYYSDDPGIPGVDDLEVDLPVIIGEFAQISQVWDDSLQLDVARTVFQQAQAGGYLAALSWYYNYAGSTDAMSHLESDGSWRDIELAFEEAANQSLTLGTNLAWFTGGYGRDMAANPLHLSWGVAYDHDVATALVDDLTDHDIPLLRFWIFEGGEGLFSHQLFEDMEEGVGRWSSLSEGVTLSSSDQHAFDGDHSLALHISPRSAGWYGIHAVWDDETALNLNDASEWSCHVTNGFDQAVGVNLAFVTKVSGVGTTYQTRYELGVGQLWIEPGQSATQVVTLSAYDFPSAWALDTAPDQGVSRPAGDVLAHVHEIMLRVYIPESQLDLSGALYLDAMRIR
ncbi:MAG: hypothetical protein JW797_04320 [Bradymonadales bacterium]|nr:hypothetical protein [Bradymonadales bacterium]